MTAERERGPDDGGNGDALQLVEGRDDARLGNAQPDRAHGVAEQLAVLCAPDRVEAGADELDAERLEDPVLGQLAGEVERGLAAHRRQQGVRSLPAEDVDDAFEVERLDVRAVGEARVGHDRRRVRVDDDRAEAVLAQHLQRLAAGVVELARLADDDRPRADDADRLEVAPTRQRAPPRPRPRSSGRASCGPGPASGWNCSERAQQLGVVETFDRPVVERDVGRRALVGLAHREPVVLARHEHAARTPVEHRVVRAAVAEGQLVRLVTRRQREQLMAEADAEHRDPAEEVGHGRDLVAQRLRVAGAVREEDAVVGRQLVRVDVVRVDGDRSAGGRQAR